MDTKDEESIRKIIEIGLTYRFSLKELCTQFKLSNRTIASILKNAGWCPKISSSLIRLSKNGVNIEQLHMATAHYLNNQITFEEIESKFGIPYTVLSRHLKRIGRLPNIKNRKTRQRAWNTGLTKRTDIRILAYAKTKSGYISSYGYSKVWSDELGKTVNEHHYVWFKNTGIWPDTKNQEQIHHIDGDKLNNDYSNLLLVSASKHTEIHKKYEQLVYSLIKKGYVILNKQTCELETEFLWKILNEG